MNSFRILLAGLLLSGVSLSQLLNAAPATGPAFRTIQLADEFHAESAAVADLDNDGDLDVVYGPYWFAGPDFKKRHLIYRPNPFATAVYSNNFFVYAEDIDADGWQDLLVMGFPGRKSSTYWFKNPGRGGKGKLWQRFAVFAGVENESPVWGDVTGDGEKEILCSIGGRFGFVAPADRAKPELPWVFTAISPPKSTGGKFTHGLGFGDVDGDGRNDGLEKSGWWEQPSTEGEWKKHPYIFAAGKGGSQMFAYDFDGDGDNDVVTALNAHGYGLVWHEQVPGNNGGITFKRHEIMAEGPATSPGQLSFSQLHALRLADIDGDGVKDIITGKRYFAHGGKDPGGKDAPVIYWFQTLRKSNGKVEFVPRLIHNDSGVGTDVVTQDVNGDGRLDVVVGNKKGCFVHLQTDKVVPATELKKAPAIRYEGEAIKGAKGPGQLRVQNLKFFKGRQWSGQAQLWWRTAKPGDEAAIPFHVPEAGAYHLGAQMTTASDYGIIELSLDRKTTTEPIDFYSPKVAILSPFQLFGPITLTKGRHTLYAKIVGKNAAARPGYMMGLDYLELRRDGGFAKMKDAGVKPVQKPKPAAKAGKGLKEGNALEATAKSAAEQQAHFILPKGFVIELVADEKDGVANPTSIAFDDAGSLWVTTAVEYPRDNDPAIWKTRGKDRIVVIDPPHDTSRKPARTFADGMVMPMSVLPYGNGAFVAQGPEILFLSDENQDGEADTRKVLVRGFGVQDTHTMPHQLVQMPGGRITFSQGVLTSGTIMDAGGKSQPFNRTLIASMTPQGTDLQVIGAGMNNIWAWAHDRVGRVFIHEANDLGYSLVQFEEDSSYPSFISSKIHPDAPLHPPTATGLNLGGTGFSGIAICDDRSGSFPNPWNGKLFVANPITGKINCAKGELGSGGVWKFTKQQDLVACKDPLFRPVSVTFGPDGCLYIVDWYNKIISHNEVARDHPARDKRHGRIWRVRHRDQPKTKSITDHRRIETRDLPVALKSDNTWAMRAAWHQISQRQDKTILPQLKEILADQKANPDARIHALWSLEDLGHFDEDLWSQALGDLDENLRRETVRTLSTLRIGQSKAAPLLKTLIEETSWTVRYEVLRYFRRAEGKVSGDTLAWLRKWISPNAPVNSQKGWRGLQFLNLDGSYQHAFQGFLLKLAETKTQLPVVRESKWTQVIETKSRTVDAAVTSARIADIKAKLAKADREKGRLLVQGMCLTCHSLGNEGIGLAPPLDGSRNRDLEGLITAIIDPNAAMERVFRSYRIVKKNGDRHEGFLQSEHRRNITIALMGGITQKVPIKDIRTAGFIEGKSVMPELTNGMEAQIIADMVAFLRTVK